MHIPRRTFLTISLSSVIVGTHITSVSSQPTPTRWMGCRKINGEYRASLIDGTGDILIDIPLPGRGHGIAISPTQKQAIVFARRPGTFALIIDLETGNLLHEITATDGRHFYGHGCYSTDGNHLYTTENDIATGNGMIGVRDCRNGFALIASHSSGGIGPHELSMMPDGDTLIIANGGIKTQPELGRAKLNLDTMSPSIVLMEPHSGRILATHRLAPDLHQLSIRHLSVTASTVALALQYQGPKSQHMPLLMQFDGATLRLAETPEGLAEAMRNYAGSITHDLSGKIIGMTSPRGDLVSFWDAQTLAPLSSHNVEDVCGIAPGDHPGEFLLTGGPGAWQGTLSNLEPAFIFTDTQWDNHLVRVT